DLAENQIRAWKIGNDQGRTPLFAAIIRARKRNYNDFAGYRFDHAASSSGEFQSRARTDSLNSAPLNLLFSSELSESSDLILRASETNSPILPIFSSNVRSARSWRNSDFICLVASNYNGLECSPE